jgi:prepilin-type N-terminal cleavage/methylation domain-containing protein
MFRKFNKKGFSLVELLVVITIIAILSVAAYTAVGGNTVKARNARRMQDLSTIQNALEIYNVTSNSYPTALADPPLTKQYISNIPEDPLKKPYAYALGASNKTYVLSALLEDEAGGLLHKAYLVGNGVAGLIKGHSYDKISGVCAAVATCDVVDKSEACLPYCP